ncbi:hypothetical protein AB0N17_45835 [Streptomyces sp. NPDC051133]|uniref:nucleotide-binding protein n=1 Tax=Streptomyces sp. NPDC051133 TaxID=3155521 RepID=UPI003429D5CC
MLGVLPPDDHADNFLLKVGRTGSHRTQAYRALAYRVRQAANPDGAGSVLIVAPRADVATGGVAANLAAALAECGDQVLLVDADPEASNLTALLPLVTDGTPAPPEAPVGTALVDAGSAGRFAVCSSDKTEADTSSSIHRLLPDADAATAAVVVTRPLLEHADALVIAQRVDGVVLVAGLDVTRRGDLRLVQEMIGSSGGRLLGAVLDTERPRRRFRLRRRTKLQPTLDISPSATEPPRSLTP